jgi:hypothetical protein
VSQTIVPGTAGAGPLPGNALPGGGWDTPRSGSITLQDRLRSASAAIQHSLSGTPGRLRMVSVAAVVAAVIAALLGGVAIRERSAALGDARSAAAHLVLIQGVQTSLAEADADATNSFLGGGLEPQGPRLDYIASIQVASRDLAIAAQSSPQDAAELGAANAALTRYTGYIASARANNRLDLPVGANYLSTASDLLNSQIVPQLQKSSQSDLAKIDDAYGRANNSWIYLALAALIGLGVLVWAQLFVARRSRRFVNVPLASATAGLLVALIVAVAAMAFAQSHANDVRTGALKQATDLSRSRVNAFTAKSNESLVLIARGSATAADTDWNKAMSVAKASLPSGNDAAASALAAYSAQHAKINTLDVQGSWTSAVTRARSAAAGSANAQFATYASQTEKMLNAQAGSTSSGLHTAGKTLLPAGILMVLIGLLAAAGAWWGISLRLDEYR